VRDQVAQVEVSQTFLNTGSRQLEVSFVFPLPYEGAVDRMTLMVDGKEFPARLMSAEEARKFYEETVRRNRDPALLEWIGTGLLRTSVFPVPPNAKRTVSLRYSQILRMHAGLTDLLFPLSTAKYSAEPLDELLIRVAIESKEEIKNVYSPTHPVAIKRPDGRRAIVEYKGERIIPASDFRLFFDVGRGVVSSKLLSYRPTASEDGYFLLLATPSLEATEEVAVRKTVIFVVDRSGSMSGKKIEQARQAAKFVLNNLREGDLFNVIAYDSTVEVFRPELQRFSEQTRAEASGFIEGLYAGGSTNINAALESALKQIQDPSQPAYILFLTDGLPTTGVTDESKIVQNAKQANKYRARIFPFGVGYDVNSRLLDRLAVENFGATEYVRPEEDIEERVGRLYQRIRAPVLTDVELSFEYDELTTGEPKPISRVYPKGSFDLFAGDQLVMLGRYRKPGTVKVTIRGKLRDQTHQFSFPATLVEQTDDQSLAFVEKLWAMRRVGEILEELDLHGRNEELIAELVSLATKHGILTPYTSFLADENVRLDDLATNLRRAGDRLSALEARDGAAGFHQRAYKGSLQQALQAMPGGFGYFSAPSSGAAGQMDAFRSGLAPGVAPAATAEAAAAVVGEQVARREIQTAAENVRQVADRAFYRRGSQWVDSTVTKAQESQARRIRQFSDEYFALAHRFGRAFTQYLMFDEPVLINFRGETYLIEP